MALTDARMEKERLEKEIENLFARAERAGIDSKWIEVRRRLLEVSVALMAIDDDLQKTNEPVMCETKPKTERP